MAAGHEFQDDSTDYVEKFGEVAVGSANVLPVRNMRYYYVVNAVGM